VHRNVGSMGSVGFVEIASHLRLIEKAIVEGEIEQAHQQLDAIPALVSRTETALGAYLSRQQS